MGRSQNHRTGGPFKILWIMIVPQMTSGGVICGLWCFSRKKRTRVLGRVSVQFFEMGFMPYSKLYREISKSKQSKPDMLLSSKSRIVVHL